MVKQWLLNEEEKAIKKTVEEIETYYAEKRNLSWKDIRQSKQLLEELNEKYQLIRVLDRKGNVVVSVSNGASISLSPSGAPKELQMDYHFVNDERFIILREPLHTSTVNGIIDDLLSGTVRIRMTKYHFEQLLLILLDNAVKYSQQAKQVAISIKEEERFVTVAVRDYGIGIPRDQLEKVFLRFYRVDKARSREKGGVGLGLAIAKEIIDKYNGQITIDSEVGKGTTVALSIPREK